ncbi:cytochrome P450 [Streptomyces sp. NPDC054813]
MSEVMIAVLTEDRICSEILTLAVAGTETTASELSRGLYEVARNPEIESRALAELDELLGDRPVAFKDVTRLPCPDRVIKEALRQRPRAVAPLSTAEPRAEAR